MNAPVNLFCALSCVAARWGASLTLLMHACNLFYSLWTSRRSVSWELAALISVVALSSPLPTSHTAYIVFSPLAVFIWR